MLSNKKSADAQDAGTKRVLYVDGNLDGTVGGSYFSLYYLVTGLDRRRFEPLVVFSTENALIADFRAAGIDTRVVPRHEVLSAGPRLPKLLVRIANIFHENVSLPIRLCRFLRREHIDLVHLNNSTTGNHEWMLAAFVSRVPCITHERGINRGFSVRTRVLAPRLSAIVCISRAVRDNFAARQFTRLRLVTILNGLDATQMRASRSARDVRASLGVTQDQLLIGLIGNIKPWKGQETVVRAVSILRRTWPSLQCLLIGGVSPGAQAFAGDLRDLIKELHVQDNIIVTGYRKDVADYVNALDVVVHASTEPEPFGRVLLEAMALRRPLVASRGGAIPEIIEEGVSGLMFNAGDPVDLARCILEMLQNPDAAAAMGERGYARLISHFSVRKNIERTQKLYERVLEHAIDIDDESDPVIANNGETNGPCSGKGAAHDS